MPFVVEQAFLNNQGLRAGTCRVWVATRERAEFLANERPDIRTWREVTADDMPPAVRVNMEGAQ